MTATDTKLFEIEVIEYRPVNRNSLLGYVDIRVNGCFVLANCGHHKNADGKALVSPPLVSGAGRYNYYFRFVDTSLLSVFQREGAEAVKEYLKRSKDDSGKREDIRQAADTLDKPKKPWFLPWG